MAARLASVMARMLEFHYNINSQFLNITMAVVTKFVIAVTLSNTISQLLLLGTSRTKEKTIHS